MDTLQAVSVSNLCPMSFLRHVREGPTLYLLQAQRIIQILTSTSLRTILIMSILS